MADYLQSDEFRAKASAMRARSAELQRDFRERLVAADLEAISAASQGDCDGIPPRDFALMLATGRGEQSDGRTSHSN